MNRIDAVFFDLDGTLTNPRLGITQSIQYALNRLGVEAPAADQLTWCIGPPLLDSFRKLLNDQDAAAAAVRFYRERFAQTGLFENYVYDDIPASLAHLAAAGASLYVATAKPQVFAERIIAHFELSPYFERIFGTGLDGALSNKADLLKHALSELAVSPQRTLMVGDRRYDMAGARRNGIGAIGVLYGFGSKAELEAAGAQRLIASPQELIHILN